MRDPTKPVEVAYFNHGDSQHTKSHVIEETGHIWASDATGFWVLELEPHVRAHLGLDDPPPASAVLGTQVNAHAPAVGGGSGRPATGGLADTWVCAPLLAVALLVRRIGGRPSS